MPYTTTAATKESRIGRPAHATSGSTRHAQSTTATVMPLWQGLALLFTPAKGSEHP